MKVALQDISQLTYIGRRAFGLVFSGFRPGCGIVDLDKVREGSSAAAATESFGGEAELFEAAAARLNG